MSDPVLLARLQARAVRDSAARFSRLTEAQSAGVTEFASVSGTELITVEPSCERPGEHRVTRWGLGGMIARADSPAPLEMLFEFGASKPATARMAAKFRAARAAAVEGEG